VKIESDSIRRSSDAGRYGTDAEVPLAPREERARPLAAPLHTRELAPGTVQADSAQASAAERTVATLVDRLGGLDIPKWAVEVLGETLRRAAHSDVTCSSMT
jgi:hypothetical protein